MVVSLKCALDGMQKLSIIFPMSVERIEFILGRCKSNDWLIYFVVIAVELDTSNVISFHKSLATYI